MTDGDIRHKIYRRYIDMKGRCNNPNLKNYKHYGGRGISVCEEWSNDFETFFDWSLNNGFEVNLSLDRIDNNGNYCPDNCRWTDRRTQNINKSSSIKSKTGYVGVTLHSCGNRYYGRLRNEEGKIIYTGMSEDLITAVKMRNEYIIEHELKNKLNEVI